VSSRGRHDLASHLRLIYFFFPSAAGSPSRSPPAVGVVTSTCSPHHQLHEISAAPAQIVSEFLIKRGPQAWKWTVIGWAGTPDRRIASHETHHGGQSTLFMKTREKPGFLHRQLRAFCYSSYHRSASHRCGLGVFGRPLRHWIAAKLGEIHPFHGLWTLFFPVAAFTLPLSALTMIYRVARPQETSVRNASPALSSPHCSGGLSTFCLEFMSGRRSLQHCLRRLAAVIGLLIWMNLSRSPSFWVRLECRSNGPLHAYDFRTTD